ncbi:hypothetical protein NPA07_04615 [Mycoplasmopsis caviae]|uniref:Uncharacterized protein n=1 Tax=Mycoplasmopsis caviae TaxID=55603 RepID=A0A3P8KBZ0_9BACT|nr:hypothetical protein [Mycoplasmopsis caviae]UUD35060.1 hypothetical protein NPA07_04615 [Mycoplasmopsis caviae]VDR42114.1 Uncharacterised protein [Mycoplasmopsis caviae]
MKKTSKFLLGSNLTIASGSLLSVLCATSCTDSRIDLEPTINKMKKLEEKWTSLKEVLTYMADDNYTDWYAKIEKLINEFNDTYHAPKKGKRYLVKLYNVVEESCNHENISSYFDKYIDLVKYYVDSLKKYPDLVLDVGNSETWKVFQNVDFSSYKNLNNLDKAHIVKKVSVKKIVEWFASRNKNDNWRFKQRAEKILNALKTRLAIKHRLINNYCNNFTDLYRDKQIRDLNDIRSILEFYGRLTAEFKRLERELNI